MSTWWHDHNAYWRAHPDESTENPCFPDHLVSLLDAVEACFVAAGGSSAWPDPHTDPSSPGGCSAPTDDEYSRLTHPERYVILEVRVRAWMDVLAQLGLAHVAPHGAGPLPTQGQATTPCASADESRPRAADAGLDGRDGLGQHDHLVEPSPVGERGEGGPAWPNCPRQPSVVWMAIPHENAPTLRVAAWPLDELGTQVEVGLSDPIVIIDRVPDCPCDACDDGSADLLEGLDRTLLSIVDGSIEVVATGGVRRERSAWDGSSGSDWLGQGDYAIRGASWFPGREPLPLITPMT